MTEKQAAWLLGIGHLLLLPMAVWYAIGQWWTMAIPLLFGTWIGEYPPGQSLIRLLSTGDPAALLSPSTFYTGAISISLAAVALVVLPPDQERARKRDLFLGLFASLGVAALGTAFSFISFSMLLVYPLAMIALTWAACNFYIAIYHRFAGRRFSPRRAWLALGILSLSGLSLLGLGMWNMMTIGGS
ncbi:hypothetical protein EON79_05340 [bacterium]|nr:MAG: hypothetical protein EON79_05340 [bacterium]